VSKSGYERISSFGYCVTSVTWVLCEFRLLEVDVVSPRRTFTGIGGHYSIASAITFF